MGLNYNRRVSLSLKGYRAGSDLSYYSEIRIPSSGNKTLLCSCREILKNTL